MVYYQESCIIYNSYTQHLDLTYNVKSYILQKEY